jgi:hypothetical protein
LIPAEAYERHIAPGGPGYNEYQTEVFHQWARARAKQEVTGGDASGWTTRIDVATIADPAAPALLRRANADGSVRGYGYPGGLHLLYGTRKCGKTMLAVRWAADELLAGYGVLWFSFESQQGIRERLAMAGAGRELWPRFDYRLAGGRPTAETVAAIAASARNAGVSLVVFDAMRGLMRAVAPGTSANDGDAVELVNSDALLPFQRAGIAVLAIDHTSKAGGGASAFGSERKESMADVVLSVELKRQFSRETGGWSAVTATADRYGYNDEDSPGYLVLAPGAGIQFREDIPLTVAPVIAEDAAAMQQKRELRHLREVEVHAAVLGADDWTASSVAAFLTEHCAGKAYSLSVSKWRAVVAEMMLSGQLRGAVGPRNAKLLRPGPGALPDEVRPMLDDPAVAARAERYKHDVMYL